MIPGQEVGAQESLERLNEAFEWLRSGPITNLKPILPLLLNLRGKPFTLDSHFPFEPFFSTFKSRWTVWKTARQVGKSTALAAQGVVQSNCLPFFNTLYVTPLYEMIRRFSANYVRGFIEQSPVRQLFVDSSSNNSVLQRSFRNNSNMFFSFAFLDAERTRGINASALNLDEAQDIDSSLIPIMREVLSASEWRLEQYTGTPKTLDGTMERLWSQSSQAEWIIRCEACHYWNIPSLDQHLDAMTGPDIVVREISEAMPGVVCAKCGQPIRPRSGHWEHRYPDRRLDFAGYHIPQLIMPMHYSDPEKWALLLAKRRGFGNTTTAAYYNECCGESYERGAKLVTVTELKAAAVLHENKYQIALQHLRPYKRRILAVDWGGGGEDEVSFTVAAVLGMRDDGKIDVIFGWRSLTPHDHFGEARQILKIMHDFHCSHLVHDFSGAGTLRETIINAAGLDIHQLIPVSYIRSSIGPLMKLVTENDSTGQRWHYRVDKSRSLGLVCNLIKKQWIRFFAYDYQGVGQEGLLHDFLALVEDKTSTRLGGDIYTIIRGARSGPDDFAQAVNIGACALYYQEQRWPDLAAIDRLTLTREQLAAVQPPKVQDWNE